MNRDEFMKELKEGLKNEDYGTVSEIINDYEEYFAHGLLEGKTEEEICSELGTPQQIIDNFIEQGIVENPNKNKYQNETKEENKSHYSENKNYSYNYREYNVPGIIGLVLLNFFLITCIVLPVGGAIFGISIGFTLAVIPSFIGSLIMLFTGNTLLFFGAISISAFMLLALIGIYFLIKWIVRISKSYIKWNINVARGDV